MSTESDKPSPSFRTRERITDEGYAAREEGFPLEANPYHSYKARLWSEGWHQHYQENGDSEE